LDWFIGQGLAMTKSERKRVSAVVRATDLSVMFQGLVPQPSLPIPAVLAPPRRSLPWTNDNDNAFALYPGQPQFFRRKHRPPLFAGSAKMGTSRARCHPWLSLRRI